MCVQSSKFPIPTKNHERLMLFLVTFLILPEMLASEILLPYIFLLLQTKQKQSELSFFHLGP